MRKVLSLCLIFSFIFFNIQLYAQTYGPGTYTKSFTVASGTATVTVQVWGGGGAGGAVSNSGSGGGGGGGYTTNTYNVGPGSYSIAIEVGNGATVDGGAGGNSSHNFNGQGVVTAFGGGGGTTTSKGIGGAGQGTGGVKGGDGGDAGANRGGGGGGSGVGATNGYNGNAGGGNASGGGLPGGGDGGDNGVSGSDGEIPGGGGGGAGKNASGISSGDGGNGQVIVTIDGVLPVELTHFAARTKDDKVELDWTTATEINNDFFQVEHSRDGIQFRSVGKVKGEGTTTETINYNFMHRQPVGGTNYYRLKQVDYDGAFEYSDIVVAEVSNRAGGVRVYPNPTIDKAVIQINDRPERVTFTLTTLLGQRLELQPGQSDNVWELDLSSLPKGVYILQMDYDGQSLSRKIVKE